MNALCMSRHTTRLLDPSFTQFSPIFQQLILSNNELQKLRIYED